MFQFKMNILSSLSCNRPKGCILFCIIDMNAWLREMKTTCKISFRVYFIKVNSSVEKYV